MLALPSAEASLCRREAGEKEKMKRAGDHGNAYFSIIAIVLGYPAVASAEEGERETDQMVVSRHRKIDVKLLNKATEDAQDDHAVVFNTQKVTKLMFSIVF